MSDCRLDPKKVSDIVGIVSIKCKVAESLVRSIITTKCSDENKMWMKRCHRNKDSSENKENVPVENEKKVWEKNKEIVAFVPLVKKTFCYSELFFKFIIICKLSNVFHVLEKGNKMFYKKDLLFNNYFYWIWSIKFNL